jgi:hypothetical protein
MISPESTTKKKGQETAHVQSLIDQIFRFTLLASKSNPEIINNRTRNYPLLFTEIIRAKQIYSN